MYYMYTPESHKKKQSRAVVKLRVGFKTLFYYGSYNKPGATISIDAFTALQSNLEFSNQYILPHTGFEPRTFGSLR